MASFNKVILMGNLTRDPQLRYLPSNNMAVCDFGLAVNRVWRDKDGNQKEEVCFIDCEAWARQAETINQYMAKGRAILVEGHLRLDTWTGQDGQKRSKHKVFVENFRFVGARPEQAGTGTPGVPAGAAYERSAPPGGDYARPGPSGGGYDSGASAAPPPEPEDIPPPSGENIPF
ncbi:MAG: single-stranded DNA-binding protein [Planctomycetota bacterium]